MRIRALVVFAFAGLLALTLSLLSGQTTPPAPLAPVPASTPALSPPPAGLTKPATGLDKLSPPQRQCLGTAQCAAEWLFRMHKTTGRFVAGFRPSLKQAVEGDFYLRQASASAALARAARL